MQGLCVHEISDTSTCYEAFVYDHDKALQQRCTQILVPSVPIDIVNLSLESVIEKVEANDGPDVHDNNEQYSREEELLSIGSDSFDNILQGGKSLDDVEEMEWVGNFVDEGADKADGDVEEEILHFTIAEDEGEILPPINK